MALALRNDAANTIASETICVMSSYFGNKRGDIQRIKAVWQLECLKREPKKS